MFRATTHVVHGHMLRATAHAVYVHMLRATTNVACKCWSIARPTARPIHVNTGKCCVQHVQTYCTCTREHVACMHILRATVTTTTNFASKFCLEHVHMLRTTTHVACTYFLENCSNTSKYCVLMLPRTRAHVACKNTLRAHVPKILQPSPFSGCVFIRIELPC
jgi:hypothetical protein